MLPMISGADDFDITWSTTGAVGGTVTLEITALRGEGLWFDGAIACSASSTSGALSVPAALLGVLPSGDTALLDLILSTDSALQAPNATVDLIAVERARPCPVVDGSSCCDGGIPRRRRVDAQRRLSSLPRPLSAATDTKYR
jgi:hypothetical protein